jgi:allantoinase
MDAITRHEIHEGWAHAGVVEAGGLVFVSYCVGNPTGTTTEQVHGALDTLESRLATIGLSLADVVTWMSQNPAEWAGLTDRGAITPGRRADMALISADDAFVVLPAELHQRNKVTAYAQRALAGVVTRTWVGGTPVYLRPATPHIAADDITDAAVFPAPVQPFTLRP